MSHSTHSRPERTRSIRRLAARTLVAVGLMAGLLGPASAQTKPGSNALPFAGVQAQGTSPVRLAPPQILAPGTPRPGAAEASDPHTILPQPPPGKAAIGMSARFGEGEPFIPRGLVWRVFADRPEASGAYPLVAEAAEPAPVFFLSPGGYVVHVSYGLASVARRIAVGADSRREQISMQAGGVKLESDVNDTPIPAQKVAYDIFEGSFLQGKTSSRPFFRGANSGDLVVLPAGSYYVVSTYGEGNAVIQADLSVQPGKVTEATLHHRAAEISLRLVAAAGGEALAEAQWSVLTPGGDTIKESMGTVPTFVLAEGGYTAIARYEGKTYSQDFTVEAGKDGPVEVLTSQAPVVPGKIDPAAAGSGDGIDGLDADAAGSGD